ncbi:MAG: hypothetical protein QOG72_1760 [Sphingomonadales bacterium]|jgi:serralysin|nr:hypothetical protein [Sphingomonadales bacterium]
MADKPHITKDGYVAALVQVGVWAAPQSPIQYAFLEQRPAYLPNEQGWTPFSAAQRAAVQQAFAMIAEVVNLTFVQVPATAQQPGPNNPRINFYANSVSLAFSGSMSPYQLQGSSAIYGADIRFNTARIAQRTSNEGFQDFTSFVAVHEVLHALGLSHPGNYNGQGPTYQNDAEFVEDTIQYSVMSYFAAANTGADHTIGSVQYVGRTPLLYDILALQSLYSPNMSTRSGDTVYGFNSNTGSASPFNFAVTTGPVVAIWDGGGTDTIDLSGYGEASLIDLNEGAFSDAGGLTRNIAIAFNVTIENAVGGAGQDRLVGNAVGNRLDGGAGADVMEGGPGDDVYVVDDPGDVVLELAGGGRDEVRTALAAYLLPANVEVLTGTSSAGQALTGNELANVLAGGAGDDLLDGGAGDDRIDGGAGRDRASYASSAAAVFVTLASPGSEQNTSGAGIDTLVDIEGLIGTALPDTLIGDGADNFLDGNGGSDILRGAAGDDTLTGGAGNDTLEGGAGNGDTAVYAGNRADYDIGTVGQVTVRDLNAADGDDGTDSLAGVELVRFADMVVQLGIDPNNPPVLGDPHMVDQIWADGRAATYTIPGTSFIDLDGQQTLTFRATLADGSALPAWLGFDAATRTFSGTPPVAAIGATLAIRVTADDGKASVSDDFTIGVTQAPGADVIGTEGADLLDGTFRAETMIGVGGDDVLRGSPGADRLDGNAGTDTADYSASPAGVTVNLVTRFGSGGHAEGDELISIERVTGSAFADTIVGGADQNRFDGGAGADTMEGGAGDDLYLVDDPGDNVVERPGEGTDEVRTNLASAVLAANVERLTGTSNGGQALTGNGLANTIVAGGGNDLLDGGAGADTMRGGAGDDVYAIDEAGDQAIELAGEGTDTIRTGLAAFSLAALPNVENLTGISSSGQALTGNGAANSIRGGSGDDLLDGGSGDDRIDGGAGHDRASYAASAAAVYVTLASPGAEQNTSGAGIDTLVDVEGLIGTVHPDTLIGDGSDNFLDGNAGADFLRGGAGDDSYIVDDPGDIVEELGGEGIDTIFTSLAGYSLLGGWIEILAAASDGPHDFRGSDADNFIVGGAGNDLLRMQDAGSDGAFGRAGNDVLYFGAGFSGADLADGGDGRDVLILQGNYALALSATNLAGIESISLQSGARTTWGDVANNFYDYAITTNDSNLASGEQLIVNGQSLRAGEDFSFDGSAETNGYFLVYGGHGVDTLKGGAGNDAFFFEGDRWGAGDTVDGGAGRDALIISSGSGINHFDFGANALTGIESISLNNRYTTDPSQKPSYELVLANGNVAPGATLIVNGSSLADPGQTVSVDGSAVQGGNLILFGGFGNDALTGGDGADLILGGEGIDELTGGGGADIFRYAGPYDATSQLPDRILDFASGVDKIDLTRIDADLFADGDQAFHWIGSNAFTGSGAASAGELRAWQFSGNWFVEGDMDGNGSADLVIQLTIPVAPPVQGDFLL